MNPPYLSTLDAYEDGDVGYCIFDGTAAEVNYPCVFIDDTKKIHLIVSEYHSSGTGRVWCYDIDNDDFIEVPFDSYASAIVSAIISSSVLSDYGGYSSSETDNEISVNKSTFEFLIAHV